MKFLKHINSYLPKFIRRNFVRKLIAIIFAFLVYFKVSNQLGEEWLIQNVPITFIKNSNIEVLAYKPSCVDVMVRGSKNRVRLLTQNDVKIMLPISTSIFKNSEFSPDKPVLFNINNEDIKLPYGIEVIGVMPQDITLHMDKEISRTLPVIPTFIGNMPQDYERGIVKVIPENVTISGPENLIEGMKSIPTNPIFVDRSSVRSFQSEVKFQSFDKNILITPQSVQVNVEVIKVNETIEFRQVPIEILKSVNNSNLKYNLQVTSADATISGLASTLEMLNSSEIHLFVDCSKIDKPGTYSLSLECWLKEQSLRVKFIYPENVTVIVEN